MVGMILLVIIVCVYAGMGIAFEEGFGVGRQIGVTLSLIALFLAMLLAFALLA